MDKIIEYLEKQINEIKTKKDSTDAKISEIQKNIDIIESAIKDPDSIDSDIFKKIFSDDLQSQIDDLLVFKGWYSSNPDESQIKEAFNLLKEICNPKVEELKTNIEELNNGITSSNELINKNEEFLSFIKNYNKDTYISEEILDKLNEIVISVGIDDEIVKLFMDIAINNSLIELSKKVSETDEVLSDETTAQIDRESEEKIQEINRVENQIEEDYSKRNEEFLSRIKAFKTNSEYKDMDEDLFTKALEIMSKISTIEYDISDISFFEEYVQSNGILNDIEDTSFIITVCIKLLNSYEARDLEEVRKTLNDYDNAISEDEQLNLNDLLRSNGLDDLADLLISLEDNYDLDKFVNEHKPYLTSLESLSREERKAALNADNESGKIIDLAILYKNAIELIEDGIIDEDIIGELKSIKENIDLIIEPKEEIIEGFDTEEDFGDDSLLPEPYSNEDFENYVVIYDKKELAKSIRETEKWMPVTNKKFSEFFIRKINTLINTPIPELIHGHNSHIVKIGESENNPYKIYGLRLGGSDIRVTFKVLETAKVASDTDKKHGVIMIFNTCYGKTNKDDELKDSITIFERYEEERYSKLKKVFGAKKYADDQQTEIDDSYEIFKKIYKKAEGMGSR